MPHPVGAKTADYHRVVSAGDSIPSNADLARVLHEIADLLEIKGELVFKTVAYHRAADVVERAPVDVGAAYRADAPPDLPGIGRAISDKLAELSTTGRLGYHEQLKAEFPATLLDLLRVPGLGPKTVRLLYTTLGIADLAALREAAATGRLRGLRGLSARTEASILEGVDRLAGPERRRLLHEARDAVDALTSSLLTLPGVVRCHPAGSFRRRRETVGDLDVLIELEAGLSPATSGVIDPAVRLAPVTAVLAAGPRRASIHLAGGLQADLYAVRPEELGSHLVHFTGSKEHNVRLRALARDRGWSLSEHGFARLGPDGAILEGDGAELLPMAAEADVYRFLGLADIPPELREDGGEIEAAAAGTLPRLLEEADLRGDLHSHSDWSDGSQSIEVMAEAARRRGHAYQVLTDHSMSLAIARGLDPDRVALQRRVIAALNDRFAREEDAGTAPAETSAEGFRLLHGCELEIRADGRLDYEDDLLATFDVVVASLHVARRQPRAELTARVLGAIRNPHVDVIAHPAGRMIGTRDDLDLDWDAVFAEAAATGTILELNGSPHRLDLSVERARRARAAGCRIAVDSDAHRTSEFEHLAWGVSQARRAWLGPEDIVNTRSRAELLAWVGRH